MTPSRPELSLAALLGDFAVKMHVQTDAEATLRTIVEAAVIIVPGISWAGISLVEGRRVTPTTPTDGVARSLNELQSSLGQGPVFESLSTRSVVIVTDVASESRWGRFTREATRLGVRCLMCFPLVLEGDALAVLTLYGPEPGMFTAESAEVAEILAQHAAIEMAGTRTERQLESAIASRDVIGQAKGILMFRDKLSGVQAFAKLTSVSQQTNIKLVDVAKFLVDEFEKDLPAARD